MPCWIPGTNAFVSGLDFVIEGVPIEGVPERHLQMIEAQHKFIYRLSRPEEPKRWFGLEDMDLTRAQLPDPLVCIRGFVDRTSDNSGIIWINGTLGKKEQDQLLYHSMAHIALGHTRRGEVLTEDRIPPVSSRRLRKNPLLIGPETLPKWVQEYDADIYAARVLEVRAADELINPGQSYYLEGIAHRMKDRASYIHDRILSGSF